MSSAGRGLWLKIQPSQPRWKTADRHSSSRAAPKGPSGARGPALSLDFPFCRPAPFPSPGGPQSPPNNLPQRALLGQQHRQGRGACWKCRRSSPGRGRELVLVTSNDAGSGTQSQPSVTPGGHSPRTLLRPPRPCWLGRWCWQEEGALRSGGNNLPPHGLYFPFSDLGTWDRSRDGLLPPRQEWRGDIPRAWAH